MRKILVSTLVVIALVAAGCGDDNGDKQAEGPSGPQSYAVDIDAAAPPQFEVSAYFPGVLTVRPGDTIAFANKSAGHPHTVTLGIKTDANRPALVSAKGEENPVAFGPCFTDVEPTPALTACPTPPNPAAPPAFAGKGYWNSGILAQASGPTTPSSITVKLADSIAPGDYRFLCMLHPFMAGILKVAASDGDRQTPTAVRADAESAAAKAVAAANTLKPPAATPGNVTAGWGDNVTVVIAYDPAAISIKAGETVTWKNAGPYEPHTVTFQSPFKTPGDAGVAAPAGVKSGGTYTSGFTSSGFFGAPPFFPSNTFTLKFAKAGSYKYVCTIHPGMAGAVTVT